MSRVSHFKRELLRLLAVQRHRLRAAVGMLCTAPINSSTISVWSSTQWRLTGYRFSTRLCLTGYQFLCTGNRTVSDVTRDVEANPVIC